MQQQQKTLVYGLLILAGLLLAELLSILWRNSGLFVFTLDDPYIHLAVAENILRGHYGVNLQEFSAPSSSILWPFLISPLTLLPASGFWVLLLNSVFAAFSVLVFGRILNQLEIARGSQLAVRSRVWLFAAFILAANLVGLAFTGMEHSLHVLLALMMISGLLDVADKKPAPAMLWFAIIASPLVRYEGLALSGAALFFLFCHRYYWQSVLSGLVIVLALGAFSIFLLSLGLGYLPDSVLTKSDVAASGLERLIDNLHRNFLPITFFKAAGLLLMATLLLRYALARSLVPSLRLLSLVIAGAIVLHLLVGRIGWYHRYEIYIWIAGFTLLFYLLAMRPAVARQRSHKWCLIAFMLVAVVEHGSTLFTIPVASNNVYSQQYQMHRFINDYYQKPIAVNDLGLTSYRNREYVLDLWGLGSSEVRELKAQRKDADWMQELVEKHGVELIMIYHHRNWFEEVPDNWIRVARMYSLGIKITVRFPVSFYTPCAACVPEIREKINAFAPQLPDNVYFEMDEL